MALVFPNDEALCAALRAGMVPPEVQRGAVRFGRTADGQLELQPDEAMAPASAAALKNAGVVERAASAKAAQAPCWAATLKPSWVGEPDTVPNLVMFVLNDGRRLLPLCGELLRLGCDRQEICMLRDGRALVRVREAPYFVIAKTSEPLEHLDVYAPGASGRFWIQLGWHHPLSDALEQPANGTLLIHGDGQFESLENGPFTQLDSLIFPVGLPDTTALPHAASPPRLAVRMRLLPSSKSEEPALWLLRNGLSAVEAFVKGAPEATLDGVLFAVSSDLVLLKVRAGRERSVAALPGDPYARVSELPNLFAPLGTALEPPLSRERLREWLAPDNERAVWLELDGGKISRQSIADDAFRPLSEWVDYVIDTSAEQLHAWIRSTTFDFQEFEGREVELSPAVHESSGDELPEGPRAPRASPRRAPPKSEGPRGPPAAPLTLTPSSPVPVAPILEQQLAHEEAAFLTLEAPAEAPERQAAWGRLATLYTALNREHESGLAFGHALWELNETQARETAAQWAQAAGSNLPALLALDTPSEGQTRAMVAQLYSLALSRDGGAKSRLPQAQAWLDKHDDNLDVRSLWLGRAALSMLAGSDALGLARARDRVLARLRRGLSLERDVPRFVRAVGPNSSRDAARVERVTTQLETLLKAFDETSRKRSLVEPPWPLTRAYVRLTFAWAFARLGHAPRARELEAESVRSLDQTKPVNAVLCRAYSVRIAQALEGVSHQLPLGPDWARDLAALGRDDRYQVDRLRQRAFVLEPQEHIDGDTVFLRGAGLTRGEELSALREISDVGALSRAIEERTAAADTTQLDPKDRARLIDGLLDFLLQLPESAALPLLSRLVALAEPLSADLKVEVLEDALRIAGHFSQTGLVKQLVARIGGLFGELGTARASRTAPLLAESVRSLRRVGLREEASTLLLRASAVLKGESLDHLMGRVAVAGGFAYLGRIDLAAPVFEEALTHLAREKSTMFRPLTADLTKLSRQTARAMAMAPANVALPGLLRLIAPLPWLTDMHGNEYYCLSLVELADILAVGHVGEDLTLSEVTRTFLEEDEYRVRRRIHREAGG